MPKTGAVPGGHVNNHTSDRHGTRTNMMQIVYMLANGMSFGDHHTTLATLMALAKIICPFSTYFAIYIGIQRLRDMNARSKRNDILSYVMIYHFSKNNIFFSKKL